MCGAMRIETKFLRLFKPVALGDRLDGWRVCWVGGWLPNLPLCPAKTVSSLGGVSRSEPRPFTHPRSSAGNQHLPHFYYGDSSRVGFSLAPVRGKLPDHKGVFQ